MRHLCTLSFLFFGFVSFAQTSSIQSGPMVGYSEAREVMIWLQTKKEAEVKIVYFTTQKPAIRFTTAKIQTHAEQAFTAKLLANQVETGTTYTYEVFVNNKKINFSYPLSFQTQPIWMWRTEPPTVKFAVGSCTFINEEKYDRLGKPYGGDYSIFKVILDKKPNFMLWLGDNTYLREADWYTQTGISHRYTCSRSVPELQALLGSVHHYAIWDDHDYGPNDSDKSFVNKNLTRKTFELFWANPKMGVTTENDICTTFEWGDVQFFLLDNRTFRDANRNKNRKDFLGQKQIDWLINALAASNAPLKIIACGGQILSLAPVKENYINYQQERTQLLNLIQENNIKGVFFLSGDRHFTELTKIDREGTYSLYDLTVSPLTSSSRNKKDVENTAHAEGTFVGEQNFGIIEIAGEIKKRRMNIFIYDLKGTEKWNKSFLLEELK